ncbi:MAG: hypothetical protein AAGF11_29255 [Myxococcota bacterium]
MGQQEHAPVPRLDAADISDRIVTADPEASGALPPPPEFLPRATSAELPLENQVRLDTVPPEQSNATSDPPDANRAATPTAEPVDDLEIEISGGDSLDLAAGDDANESMEVELPTDFGSTDYDPAQSVELPVDLDGSDERVPVHNTMPAVEVSKSYPIVDSPSPAIPRARVRAFGDPLVTQPPRSMALWFGLAIALVVVGVGAWVLTRSDAEPPTTASVSSTTRPDATEHSGPGPSPKDPPSPQATELPTEPTRPDEVPHEAEAKADPSTSAWSDPEPAAGSDMEGTPPDAALGEPSTSAPTGREAALDDGTPDDGTPDDGTPDDGTPDDAPDQEAAPAEPPPRTTPAPTLAPGEDPANDPAYRRAAERYAQTEAQDALLEMTIAGCALREGPLARAAFRKLKGRALRTQAIVECRELDIDVTAKTEGYTGPELLAQAQRALEAGDVQTAFEKAHASNKVSRSNKAIQLRARTACSLGNAAEARRMLPHISKKSRPAVIAHCREAGIELPS